MASNATITVRISEAMPKFLAAALDLLAEVENADEMLLTDDVQAAASRLREVIAKYEGKL